LKLGRLCDQFWRNAFEIAKDVLAHVQSTLAPESLTTGAHLVMSAWIN
jgi:hypothetical protein